MIRDIQLSGQRFDGYSGDEPGNSISGLHTLNVFIGPNNAGKSRLLRAIFAEKELRFATNADELEALRRAIDDVRAAAEIVKESNGQVVTGHKAAFDLFDELRCPFYSKGNKRPDDGFSNLFKRFQRADGDLRFLKISQSAEPLNKPVNVLEGRLKSAAHLQPTHPNWHRIYIPSLRGLRPFGSEADVYRDRTIEDYFGSELSAVKGQKKKLEEEAVVTGLSFYRSVRNFLLGTLQERNRIREYEQYLSRSFFRGEEVSLIPREGKQVLYLKIGAEKEQAIHDLGDGMQQIIIQTLPLILHADKHLIVCIEEPELYLHPGYQRLLIERFLDTSNCEGRQVFVATHSQQFLDMTLDHSSISVYRVTKQKPEQHDGEEWMPTFDVSLRSDDDRMVLQELGIHNSSILLANCTIWVEGITDRMYVRHFLKLWHEQEEKKQQAGFALLQEDIHYAFVEYSGNNITHWSFLDDSGNAMNAERLCGEVFLIADKDSGKDDRHKKLTEYLGNRAYILPCREIENLMTPEVIRGVIENYEDQDVSFRNFKQDTYADARLGKFIESKVLAEGYKIKRRGGYAAESGTVKDKLGFAERAIKAMDSYEMLSPQAQALADKIIDFIREMNPA